MQVLSQSFNPYRVFKFAATFGIVYVFYWIVRVSIPIGFSSSLQHEHHDVHLYIRNCFNPYRVFKFAATLRECYLHIEEVLQFQSLSGFQVRCNPENTNALADTRRGFNPYRVFKFAATGKVHMNIIDLNTVSIPIGFSSSLQHWWGLVNPYTNDLLFQSLSGFQVRCNVYVNAQTQEDAIVSIPIGFSSSLQPHIRPASTMPNGLFQSLSGFQVRCNLGDEAYRTPPEVGFNPYRVFKFAATRVCLFCYLPRLPSFNPYRVFKFAATGNTQMAQRNSQHRFNPYRVFKFAATIYEARQVPGWYQVSIPIGFSSSLQPSNSNRNISSQLGFNPYRVFKFAATY